MQWNNSVGYDYQPSIGGRPGRGRAGFGPPVSGFSRGFRGGSRDGDFVGGRGRSNYMGRHSYDRRSCKHLYILFSFQILMNFCAECAVAL